MSRTGIRSTLVDRRHIAAALTIGLMVEIVSLGAVGFAVAGDPAGDLPPALTLPRPHVGDRGVYELTVVEARGDTARPLTENRTWMEFEWLEDAVIRDRAGRRQLVHRVHDVVYEWDEDEEDYTPRPAASEIDSRTWREIAYTYLGNERSVEPQGSTGTHTHEWRSMQRILWAADSAGTLSLCGMLNPFQGRELPLTQDPVRLSRGGCDGARLTQPDPAFRPVGTETIAGYETVMFTARDQGLTTHIWLSPELPYPVRFAVEALVVGPPDGDDPDERAARSASAGSTPFYVLRLTRFARGDAPIRLGQDVPEAPLEPIALGPLQPHGPDESGVDHPFPLSEAFAAAKEDDAVAAFLRDHPEAYLYSADYSLTVHDHRVERRWFLAIDDGTAGLRLWVSQVTEPAVPLGPLGHQLGLGPQETRVEVEVADHEHWEGVAPPALVPDRAPTVASVMDWWDDYRDDAYADTEVNGWGFEIRCNHAECTGAEVQVSAGHRLDETESGSILSGDESRLARRSMLSVDGQGQASQVYETRQRQEWSQGAPPPAGDPDEGPAAVAGARLAVPIWSFPAEHAAAIGLVAALTALLYWAWPALKALPLFPLHTRLGRDDLLDHPVRSEILDALRDRPGIHRAALADELGLAEGTVRHHLGKLVQGGLVTASDAHGFVCYFPRGEVDLSMRRALPALTSVSARRVLHALMEAPGRSNKELAEATGLSPSTVHHHVQRLREAGLVEARREGRRVALSPTEVAERALQVRTA